MNIVYSIFGLQTYFFPCSPGKGSVEIKSKKDLDLS